MSTTNLPIAENNVPTRAKPRMSRAEKGKSKYQLKIERNDPNRVRALQDKALIELTKAVERGDVRAITYVCDATNALKQSSGHTDVSALAALLPSLSKHPKPPPTRSVDIESPTTFPEIDSQPADNTLVIEPEVP